MNPIKLEIFLDDKTLAGMKSAENNIGEIKNYMQSVISQLEAELKGLQQQFNTAFQKGINADRELADVQALKGAIEQLKAELKELEVQKKTTSATPIMSDDPAPKLNNVKMSMQQIARELPALAMGPQMFFLAISNNIPMFTDAVASARKEYERLTAAGQKATPIWKQLFTSLFSWQTAMATAITLTVVYGKEIGEWIKGLSGAKKAVIELSSAETEMSVARKKAVESIRQEQAELNVLYLKLKDASTSTKERTVAANEWLKKYPEYANVLNGENVNVKSLDSAYESLTQQLLATAKARAYLNKIADVQSKKDDALQKRQNQYVTYLKAEKDYQKQVEEYNKKNEEKSFGSATSKLDAQNKMEKARLNVIDQKQAWMDLIDTTKAYDGILSSLEKKVNLNDALDPPQEGTYDYWKQQKERSEGVLKEIKSNIKKTLDDASKEGKDLFSSGLDKTVVETYVGATKDLKQAKKELEVYDEKDKKGKGGKTLTDYENELADARIRAQQKIEAARITVMADGYQKRKAIVNQEYKESLAAIDKEERDTLAKLEKSKKAGKKVTPEEEKQVKDAATSQRAVAMAQYMQSSYDIEKEWRDKNQQAWIDYNKEYGTYQEKRLAITQDYALKIGRAETAGEKASLKKKRNEDLSDLYFNEINKNFNLADVFSNLDKQSTDALLVLRDKLKGYINGAAKQLRPSDLKELQNALAQMDVKLAERKPFQELKKSLSEYRQAQEALKTAQQDLNTVMAGGEVIIGFYTDETGKLIKKLLTQEQAEKKLSDASNRKSNAQQNMTTAFFSIQEHGGKLIQSGYQLADMFESLGLTIPDSFRDTLDGINQMISGLGGLKSEDMATRFSSIMSFITGLMSSLASMLNSFGDDKNSRLIDQLETINDIYQKILDKSKEDIVFGGGFAAIAAASSAMETLIKQTENYRKLARREGDKSDNNQGLGMLSKETISTLELAKGGYIQRISELLGKSFKGVEDLYDMSEEELALIRDKLPEAWALVDESIRKNLDSLADMKDEALEIQTALNEALTGINQDSFYNEFIDNISDMDMSFEDMCSNFEGYLRKSILAGLVASQYKTRISDLYKQWSDAAKSDEKITKEESDALKEEYQNIIKDMIAERDSMADAFGWKGEDGGSSQSGRSGAYVAMTQEQGTLLEGLYRSLQDHVSAMHQLLEDLKQGRDADHELFVQIADNTSYCKLLQDILEIWEEMKRDGMKMKG